MRLKTFILNSILFFPLLIFIGCATQKAKPYIGDKPDVDLSKVQTLSFQQVKETIHAEKLSFTSLKARSDITITGPEINGELKCKGVVRFQRPGNLRVIGSKLARTVFDMLSDGENYWFYLPKEKVVYTGKCDEIKKTNTNAYIFPDDIAAILEHDRLFEGRQSYMETWPAFWLVHILEKSRGGFAPYGRLKINRIDSTVTELTMFKPDSFIRAQASFHDYTKINDQTVPETVQINWPETNTTLTFNLKNITINEYLKPEIFQFKKPRKADIIEIN
ncbi:MAG: LolA family protein [Planctomycetota bacterium]|jgi:outer membrane lipoprotein-sorting protein